MIDAIITLLKSDAAMISGLASWGSAPAVFGFVPAPNGCHEPLITVTSDGGEVNGTRGARGYSISASIVLWGKKEKDTAELRTLAMAVTAALDRARLDVNGYSSVALSCSAPARHTDSVYPGYRMTVSGTLREIGV